MYIEQLQYNYCIYCFIQVDGVSLLVSSLRHWLSWEERCPRILVSTHFHSVIQQKLLPDTQLVEYMVGPTTPTVCVVYVHSIYHVSLLSESNMTTLGDYSNI